MATGDVSTKYGAATALTITLNSLAAGSFATSSSIDPTASATVDVLVEILIADITESGNKQVIVYAVSSVDGTNFSDATRQSAMVRLGALDITGTGPFRSASYSVAAGFGGVLPRLFKIVVMNDAGAALASTGNSAQYITVYQNVSP